MNELNAKQSDVINRMRDLQSEIFQAQRDIEDAIGRKQGDISRLARGGTRPAPEVLAEITNDLEERAERGRVAISRYAKTVSRPNHEVEEARIFQSSGRPNLSALLGIHGRANGAIDDNSDIIAALLEKPLKAALKAAVEVQCADPTVPPADERPEAIRRAVIDLQKLEDERDNLQDRAAELFGGRPSARAISAAAQAREQEQLDALNELSARGAS